MEETINEIINEVLKNLMKTFTFYIPQELLDYLKLNEQEWVSKTKGKIYFIDEKGNLIEADSKIKLNIASKAMLLNENIFKLYNLKDNHGIESFKYIIEKYDELIYVFLFMSEWLNNNAQKDLPNLNQNQSTYFDLQFNALLKHKREFVKKFKIESPTTIKNNKTEQIILINAQSLITDINNRHNVELSKLNKNTAAQNKLNKKEKHNRIKNSTLKVADKYILKNIFNVKMN